MKNIQSAAHVKIAKAYSFFSSMEEMDQHVTGHMETLKSKTTARRILQFLAQHSLTYPGTSWVKVKKIADAVGRSVRTVNYALTFLENKNIIQRVPVMREKKGGNSSNIIAILPFADALHDVNIPSDRTPNTPDTPDPNPTNPTIDEPTDTNLQTFTRLIQYKWKDNIVRHSSSYMKKSSKPY
ncbi:winged helix-turn-helix domain-containing protein [Salibacterium salarium]|uniref:Winged helix-turn-helix domain-containing protein n=1 Tax=Salibacterium salarium TaxID=284579 RepID=A0A428MUA5_9BACI|nr:winged helix-turn-helix domain-containing protein [Salibacterium salarium]RSL29715.1 winged helix-turn-helix domain-containing protein [Salibacterium salarium]